MVLAVRGFFANSVFELFLLDVTVELIVLVISAIWALVEVVGE
ncbi:MAG: hypothetical protein WC885_02370 [Candidatus Shapirobacteria bacterium]